VIDDPKLDELPQQLLEEWTVPDVPHDLSARVMSRIHESPPLTPPLVFASPSSRASTVVATGAAVFAAAAAAAALVISVARPSEPAIVVPSVEPPAATPVVVSGETHEQRGHLVLDVAPGDAIVEIDGVAMTGPTPFVATNLPAGKHELRVHRDGYVPWVKVIDVPAAELQLPITLVTEKPTLAAGEPAPDIASFVPPKQPAPGEPAPSTDPLGTKVRQAKASVGAGLDADIVRRVVRAHIDEIRQCYNRGLARNESLAGRVAVTFIVAGSGAVESAKIVESTLADKDVEECIRAAVSGWKFPKPEGGTSVTITYPFVLEAG
jgi:TonB family protein